MVKKKKGKKIKLPYKLKLLFKQKQETQKSRDWDPLHFTLNGESPIQGQDYLNLIQG